MARGQRHPDPSKEPGLPAETVKVPWLKSVAEGKETKNKHLDQDFSNITTDLTFMFGLLILLSRVTVPGKSANTIVQLWTSITTTHSRSLEWHFLFLLFLLLLFFLLLLVLLRPCGCCELGALTLLNHQAAVVLVTGVIPGGLARGEIEIVDLPCHVLAAGEEGGVTSERPGWVFPVWDQ